MNPTKFLLILTLLAISTVWGNLFSWFFPSMKEGILSQIEGDEIAPSISPDARYTVFTLMNGSENPIALVDNLRRKIKFLRSSVVFYKSRKMNFSMDTSWNDDSKKFVFVTFGKDMDVILADVSGNMKKIGRRGIEELMPYMEKGKILMISAKSGKSWIELWTRNGFKKLINPSGTIKVYPKFFKDGFVFVEYNLGKAEMVFKNQRYHLQGYQISSIYPFGGKILVVANSSQFYEDLFLFDGETFKLIDKDILGNTVFWLDSEIFGYVKKSDRETVILVRGDEKRSRKLIGGKSIEWISSSRKRWIAVSIYDPVKAESDVYIFNMEWGE